MISVDTRQLQQLDFLSALLTLAQSPDEYKQLLDALKAAKADLDVKMAKYSEYASVDAYAASCQAEVDGWRKALDADEQSVQAERDKLEKDKTSFASETTTQLAALEVAKQSNRDQQKELDALRVRLNEQYIEQSRKEASQARKEEVLKALEADLTSKAAKIKAILG